MTKRQKKTIREEIGEELSKFVKDLRCGGVPTKLEDWMVEVFSKILQRFIEETIGKMYRNVVLSDKYPDLAKESRIKFEARQEIEEKMKQWLKENL